MEDQQRKIAGYSAWAKVAGGVVALAAIALLTAWLGPPISRYLHPGLAELRIAVAADTVQTSTAPAEDAVVDGIHVATGLVYAENFELVRAQCTACHSSKMITQFSATREGWESTIRWMQRTQKLWDLGENEGKILDYLALHYAPEDTGRRPNLDSIQWYVLEGR